jgi:lysophospholipase L1-like esterase
VIARDLLAQTSSHEFRIYNRGVSGDRCTDLLGRWRRDTLALQPDLVSILVGVNDTWHQHLAGTGISVEDYAVVYRLLLQDVRRQNPRCRLVLCEPFALPGGAFKPEWMDELRARGAVVRQLAQDFGATFVPFQEMFNEAMKTHPAAELAADGVHPSELGHKLMAEAWRKATGL